MINRPIEYSAHNRFAVIVLVACAVAAGWRSFNNLPLDAIPDLSITTLSIYGLRDRFAAAPQ